MFCARSLTKRRREVSPNVGRKVFVVTEATSRTGFAAARTAAELGGEIIILDRRTDLAAESVQNLKSAVPHGSFRFVECDMQDFQSVRRAVEEIKAKYNMIYCLANGAGDIPTQHETNMKGDNDSETQNKLSHILITAELLPLLEAQAREMGDARIANHSSIGSLSTCRENRDGPGGNAKAASGADEFRKYFQSKLSKTAMRSPTAFKNCSSRPGTPLLAWAQFIRIKGKGRKERSKAGSKPKPLVYSGIY
mmetsp:Transcript_14832/g.28459  ORF Transcript_14832/g.28459 Transcript_14832/m.28459 type:complete len:251 (-) Transcript_14832:131-883(-)